jgi:hypothetical protein
MAVTIGYSVAGGWDAPFWQVARQTCPCCDQRMDLYGDHLVSCKNNQLVQRHNPLRDALADALMAAGVTVLKEVAVGGARRPADLALPSFNSRGAPCY